MNLTIKFPEFLDLTASVNQGAAGVDNSGLERVSEGPVIIN